MNEFKTKLETILRADTTLRTLLSKATSPYGVYYMKPPVNPSFPLVAYKLIGGLTDSSDWDAQTRTPILQIVAYGSNADAIMERVEFLLMRNPKFTGMTTCDVLSLHPEVMGFEDFDVEFQCYTRMDRYRVFLSKIPT